MAAPITLGGDVAASGVAALGSLANSFLGNIMGRSNMSKQIQASKELMKYEWNNFKSPAAQANALAAAGFNPTALFGSSGGSIATPSPVMPTAATFQQPSVGDISSFVLAMAQAKKAQADAKKAGVDTRLAEVETEAKQYELDLNKVFRSPERIAQLTLAWKNVRLSDDEHNIKVWTETKEKALAGLSEAQRDTALKVLDNMDIQLEQENKQREESIKLTQEEQKTEGTKQISNRASAAASSASARLSNAQAQTEDDLREYRKNALELGNKLQGLEYGFNRDTYQQRLEKFASELGIVKWTAFLNEIEAKDRNAYNAVQRLLMGKGVKEDGKTLWNLINDGRQLIPYK